VLTVIYCTSDAFTRRERGSEEMWIKEQERAKYVEYASKRGESLD
jgi:triosephosphate isomerase